MEDERRRIAEAARIDRINTANARASVGLAATFIGFSNEDLGRRTQAVGNAVFSVREGLKAYDTARASVGVNMDLASIALAGNFVGAAMNLAGVFLDTGPSPEEIILEELGRLRKQVNQVRIEMHGRFDQVDAQLDEIYQSMVDGFDVVNSNLDIVLGRLENANSRLRALSQGQRAIEDLIVSQAAMLDENMRDQHFALAGCFDDSLPVFDTPVEDYYEDFRKCVAGFGELAGGLPRLQLESTDAVLDRTINKHFRELKRQMQLSGSESLGRARSLPEPVVVGPDAWFYVARRYEEYLAARPNLVRAYREYLSRSEVVRELRAKRSDLLDYMETVKDELQAFQNGLRPTAFSSLLADAREQIDAFGPIVSASLDRYYDDERISGLQRVRRNGKVVPEVRFEAEEPRWRSLSEFYEEDDTPKWANIVPKCELDLSQLRYHTRATRDAVRNMLDDSFRGGALEQWLHPDVIAPARLGMGNVDICESVDISDGLRGRLFTMDMGYWENYQVSFHIDYCGGGVDVRSASVFVPVVRLWVSRGRGRAPLFTYLCTSSALAKS